MTYYCQRTGGKNYEFDCFQNFTGARNRRTFGRDERGKNLMLDMLNSAPVTRIGFLGYIVFVITLIVAIVTGIATFPIWAVIFTVLPVFILLFPFRIIGTLHISAMISMLVWMFLL